MKSLKVKFTVVTCIICGLCLMLISGISYYLSSKIIFEEITSKTKEETGKYAANFDSWLEQQREIVKGTAQDLEIRNNFEIEGLKSYLKQKTEYYKSEGQIYDLYIGFTDKKMACASGWEPDATYDATTREWYKAAITEGKAVFTAPYQDADSKKMVVTVSTPVKSDGAVIGVLAIDIFVDTITGVVKKAETGKKSYAFLIDEDNNIIVHPNKEYEFNGDKSTNLKKVINNKFEKFIENINIDRADKVKIDDYDKVSRYFIGSRLKSTGWAVGIAKSRNEFINPLISLFIGFAVAMIISLLLSVIIIRGVVKKLLYPIEQLKSAANGDLTKSIIINSNDEIGELASNFNGMIGRLKELLLNTGEVSSGIEGSAKTMAGMSEVLSESAEGTVNIVNRISKQISEQHRKTEEASKEITSFGEQIDIFGNYSKEMKSFSDVMSEKIKSNVNATKMLKETATQTNRHIEHIFKAIKELDEKSSYIGKIVEVITQISEQTSLLALNASIEAARAGEAGRGFAVVAGEIKKLSEQTKDASAAITEKVSEIQRDVSKSVDIISKSNELMDKNMTSANDVQGVIEELSEVIYKTTMKNEEIYQSVDKLVNGKEIFLTAMELVNQISKECHNSIDEINMSAQEQLDHVKEVVKSAEELKDMSEQLKENSSIFKV